jgi:hypothetical protein
MKAAPKDLERDERARAAFLAATEPKPTALVLEIRSAVADGTTCLVPGCGGTKQKGVDYCDACRADELREYHAAEVLDASPRPAPPPQHWTVRNGPDIIARSIAGDDADLSRRAPSLAGFTAAKYASADWGTPVRSSGDPSRFGGGGIGSSGFGKPPTALQAREEYAVSDRDDDRVIATLVTVTVASGYEVTPRAQFELWKRCGYSGPGVLSWRVIRGQPVKQRKGYDPPKQAVVRVPERHKFKPGETSEDFAKAGIVITPREIGIMCAEVERRLSAAYAAHGWIRPAAVRRAKAMSEESSMAKPNEDRVEGWKSIAPIVGRSEDTCSRLSRRANDPLPVSAFAGRIVAYRSELTAWVESEIERERTARRVA